VRDIGSQEARARQPARIAEARFRGLRSRRKVTRRDDPSGASENGLRRTPTSSRSRRARHRCRPVGDRARCLQRELVDKGPPDTSEVPDGQSSSNSSRSSRHGYAVKEGPPGTTVAIEILLSTGHDTTRRMIAATKAGLGTTRTAFGPYQHKSSSGSSESRVKRVAQSFPNTIPFGESGFIARVSDDDTRTSHYPYYVTSTSSAPGGRTRCPARKCRARRCWSNTGAVFGR